MPYGVASPKQVELMARVLAAYCEQHTIPVGPEREALAERILAAFNLGHRTEDELTAALEDTDTPTLSH